MRDLLSMDNPRTPDNIDDIDLIFGTDYKLSYIDPYLYMAYSLRKYSLSSHLIISVGYGFRDEHINGILRQALIQDPEKHLLAVIYDESDRSDEEIGDYVAANLKAKSCQLSVQNTRAATFLKSLSVGGLKDLFPPSDDTPF